MLHKCLDEGFNFISKMKRYIFSLGFLLVLVNYSFGQNSFPYTIELKPVNIPGLPGLHSFAHGQYDNKWLIIGGRKDGLHARQPFNAFPQSQNNTDIYVIDINTLQFWSSTLNNLPVGIKEQLQSTNMNFYQDGNSLFIAGGYAFSSSENDHITFPNLTAVNVPGLINAVINGGAIQTNFKQITDDVFAVTGGYLKKLGNTFYLVGGHRFDGRYNPMGHPSYTQTYTNQIRKFSIHHSESQLSFSNYETITDPVHLRRRDYNLLPQIFPNREEGFTISSGVFQQEADLPYLYPVDITEKQYKPVTAFNQYLSNYHSAFFTFYDSTLNKMHSIFFGGISQYYYQDNQLINDKQVPFVKTISRLTRYADGTLKEYQMPVEMPSLQGASAEFIHNPAVPHFKSGIIKINQVKEDSILVGHIYGGISSPALNPFNSNRANITSASNVIYAVTLIKSKQETGGQLIDGNNPYDIMIYPNPADNSIIVKFDLVNKTNVHYYITNPLGQLVKQEQFVNNSAGVNNFTIRMDDVQPQILMVTFVFDDKFFVTKKVIKN